MDNVKNKKRYFIYKILIIVFFVIGAILVANVHEPWSDEAQSFLLARDNSLNEIMYYAKLEGTCPLWFIIIKLFISLGGNYKSYYIVPILFTTIGLFIFEFKVKAPKEIKVLFPFTYFIFYQYSIVARSYCLIFPCLMAICSIYRKRKEKPLIYCLLLLFLMNICSYTLVIAGSLYLIDILELFNKKSVSDLYNKNIFKKIKNIKLKNEDVLPLIVIFLELLFSLLMLIPDKNCNFRGNGGRSFGYIIYHATIGSMNTFDNIYLTIVTAVIIFLIIYAIIKEKERSKIFLFSCILLIPLILENMFLTCQMWHIGIVTIMIFTVFILNNMINTNKLIKNMLIVICIVQIMWTIGSIGYDIKNNYSASKDVANFLIENNYEEKNVYGLGFDITAILPYFKNNIFKNQNSEKSFWIWSESNGYIQNENLLNDEADIYVISDFYRKSYKNLITKLQNNGYREYYFSGSLYTKVFKYENKGYIVFQKE